MCFDYVEDCPSLSASWKGKKRGRSSLTGRILDDPDAQLEGKENSCGQQANWRYVYGLIECDSSACHLGPYCWLDLVGKKHCRICIDNFKRLVNWAEEGGVLETRKDVHDVIGDDLYTEQQRQEEDKRKSGKIISGRPYPPININVLPYHSAGLDVMGSSAITDPGVLKKTL